MLTRTSLALLSSLSLASSAIVVKPRQSVTIPPECDVIPTWEVTTFSWFNSSQNLDCANEVDVRKSLDYPPNPQNRHPPLPKRGGGKEEKLFC